MCTQMFSFFILIRFFTNSQTNKNNFNTNHAAVFPGQKFVCIGSHCPAARSSVYFAAPRPSAGELKLLAAAETAEPWTKPDLLSDEPEGDTRG